MQVLQWRENFVQHCFLLNLSQAYLTFKEANNKAIRWHTVKHVILWVVLQEDTWNKRAVQYPEALGICLFCGVCILYTAGVTQSVGTHMSQQTVLKEQGLKTTVRKWRFIITVTAFVIHWFDVLERFSMNFSEEWLLLLYKNLKSFLFPCLQWFFFLLDPAVPIHRMLPFYEGHTF